MDNTTHRVTKTDRQTHRQTDWQTDRQTHRQTDWQTDRQTHRQTDWQTDRLTGRLTDKQTDRQTHRQTDWLTNRQTDKDRQRDKDRQEGGQEIRKQTNRCRNGYQKLKLESPGDTQYKVDVIFVECAGSAVTQMNKLSCKSLVGDFNRRLVHLKGQRRIPFIMPNYSRILIGSHLWYIGDHWRTDVRIQESLQDKLLWRWGTNCNKSSIHVSISQTDPCCRASVQ